MQNVEMQNVDDSEIFFYYYFLPITGSSYSTSKPWTTSEANLPFFRTTFRVIQ